MLYYVKDPGAASRRSSAWRESFLSFQHIDRSHLQLAYSFCLSGYFYPASQYTLKHIYYIYYTHLGCTNDHHSIYSDLQVKNISPLSTSLLRVFHCKHPSAQWAQMFSHMMLSTQSRPSMCQSCYHIATICCSNILAQSAAESWPWVAADASQMWQKPAIPKWA